MKKKKKKQVVQHQVLEVHQAHLALKKRKKIHLLQGKKEKEKEREKSKR